MRRWPERIAVDIPPGNHRPARTQITYAQLDDVSNLLARHLRKFIRSECVVCILLPRTSPHHYAAQLAVLKAGAAYTCIDPSFPDQRVRDILDDTGAPVLLTDRAGLARAGSGKRDSLTLLDVDVVLTEAKGQREVADGTGIASWLTPESLAYVIYTSGTTGKPKGVMIEHRSITNLIESDLEMFGILPGDRVAQGSSAAYDSSVEEIWFALAAGATLVVLDDDDARSGPDLISWLRCEAISVFCPPPTQLRTTGCRNPERELPDVRLIFVGGEPLPPDLAASWALGRQLINDYGPTECTVTCLRARIEPGEPISIGRPVRNVNALVLDQKLEESSPGECGELCIGGIGLARGYWKQPEETAKKFINHPRFGRLYRTGDLVHRDAEGRFFYHGRIDSQVKLRGYRIELGEIEMRLAACDGVQAAACCVQDDGGSAALVAFVVSQDPARPPSPDALKAELGRALPRHMVPGLIGFLPCIPTTISGKLDRAALPRLREMEGPQDTERVPPRSALEAKIQAAFITILGRPARHSIYADFFNDLGGDSLSAAEVVTILREDPETAWLTARDIYEARTVAGVASRAPGAYSARDSVSAPLSDDQTAETPPVRMGFVTLIQTAWLLKNLIVGSIVAYAGVFLLLPAVTAAVGPILVVALAPPAILTGLALYTVLAISQAVWMKKRLIGCYKPIRAPIWGAFYLRNWIVQQTARQVPWWLIEGTEFQNAALRALGARIGQRVHIDRGVDLLRGGWDLLEIGDDVTIARDAALGLVEYDSGQIIMGTVALGTGATLDIGSYVASGACVEANGYLTARSVVPRGGRVPAGECWDGIPARPRGESQVPPPLPVGERRLSPRGAGIWMVLAKLTLAGAIAAPLELLTISAVMFFGVDDETALAWLSAPAFNASLLLTWMFLAMLPGPFLLLVEALACRVMGSVHPGVISRWSPRYIRIWLKTGLLDSSSRWLYGTLIWSAWLRLAGMRVGRGCEISTLIDAIPEMVEIGDRTFCTDGLYLGGARIHRGTVMLARTRLGSNDFLGNGAIIPGGVNLPDDVLLGVCTIADPLRVRAGTSWFGHPAFLLPRREVVALNHGPTQNPSALQYLGRVFWELMRFALPAAVAVVFVVWYTLLTAAEASVPLPLLLAVIPLLTFAGIGAITGLILALKWILLGRVRPGMHPLWSSWASRWDLYCMMWSYYVGDLVFQLDGTLLLGWLLRAAGVRVGKGVLLSRQFAADLATPDMLKFEDGATVDGSFQDHTFEDRVLKMDYVTVCRNATVGRNAVLLYGSEIGVASRVAPNSVVMKNERLPAGQTYSGFPVRQQDGAGW